MNVTEYIKATFPQTVRKHNKDEDTLIGLPYPYTVPCAERYFNELYYWDTYFTNKGLMELGDIKQAKNNVLNILYLIDKFGYMPNGNRTYYLKRSQPPYAALMTDDIYKETGDLEFLRKAFPVLKREYDFWMTRRITQNGLNRYDTEEDEESCKNIYENYVPKRIECDFSREATYAGRCYFAEMESGWDFTPRFHGDCAAFNPVDLNSNLYLYETLFARYEVLLGEGNGEAWLKRAKKRAYKINCTLWDEKEKVYKDYNYNAEMRSKTVSAASFQPYFAGVATEKQKAGLFNILQSLEGEYGLFATASVTNKFQWAYPNVWAPYHYIAVSALEKFGYKNDAKRIAQKYCLLVEKNYEKYGKLFEKYNGLTGDINAVAEYGTPEMLGWTAGVYLYLKRKIK